MTDRGMPPSDRTAIEPDPAQLAAVAGVPADEPLVMLNLLRFREVADYSAHPDLAPDAPISGADAYDRYGEAAAPHIAASGAEIPYLGVCHATAIGPAGEEWDRLILVRYPSVQAFLDMVTTPDYIALSGHRTAALADSRLVPTTQIELGRRELG